MSSQKKEIKEYTPDIKTIKNYISRFFSHDLRVDQSLGGSMERKQLEKWLLNWASQK